MNETITNRRGETLFVLTLWSPLALDHVTAHVWTANQARALAEIALDYPRHRVDAIREGTLADLD